MRYAAPYNPDLTALDAFQASVRVWLDGLIAFLLKFLATLDPQARRRQRAYNAWQLKYALAGMRRVLFVRAIVQLNMKPAPQRDRLKHHNIRKLTHRAWIRAIIGGTLAPCEQGLLESRIAAFERLCADQSEALARIIARAKRVLAKLSILRVIPAAPSRHVLVRRQSPATPRAPINSS